MKVYAMADQHGILDGLSIPPCDLLLHAGDVCPDFRRGIIVPSSQAKWFEAKWMPWLKQQPVKICLVTWGNHDFITERVNDLVRFDETARMFVDGKAVNIWFSPWSKQFMNWAWMQEDVELSKVYAQIPADTHVIVSHQPPYGYGDTIEERYLIHADKGDLHQGSKSLLAAIDRIQPRIVICGHIHGAYGTYQRGETIIYNVSVVDEAYKVVRTATEIPL